MNNDTTSPALGEFLKTLSETNQKLLQEFVNGIKPHQPEAKPEAVFQNLWGGVLSGAGQFIDMQSKVYKQQMDLWVGLLGGATQKLVEPEKGDRRFTAPEWEQYPIFDYIKQYYLLTSKWLTEIVDKAVLDEESKEKLGFFARQYIDAMSPSNFALTNPEVIKLALETKGASLVEGMRKMVEDMEKGHISLTDENLFEVGRNLAVTPGTVVFENELFQLIQYTPTTEKVYERPLLVVPPCVNKYYLMDLQPENSFVSYMVERGYTTFLISWKSITPELGKTRWDDYIDTGITRACEVVREISKQEKLNILGFCVGGVIVATALAVLKARKQDWIESLTLMTVMIDHGEPGDIKMYIDWDLIREREAKLEEGGVISGKGIGRSFSTLRANDLIWNYVVNNYLKGKTPPPFDLLYWNNDSSNLALPMHTFFLRNMYMENNLTKPGATHLCGFDLDMRSVEVPTYIFAAREDHIVPWKTAYRSADVLGGDCRFVLGASGHIAGSINPVRTNKRNYWVNETLEANPDVWLEKAESRPGSWWQDWDAWLSPKSGKQVAAPKTPGNAKYKAIESAPGRYVKEKAWVES